MPNKLMNHKGFTLVEALVSLALLGFLMLAVTGIITYVSEAAASDRIEESLHSVAISVIEEKRHVLQTAYTLPCGRDIVTGEIGDIEYVLICNTEDFTYEGAYSLTVTVNSSNGVTISNEVILYA